MERMIGTAVLALSLAAGAAWPQDGKKKDETPDVGPLSLPALAAVQAKCKPGADQAPKLEALYADAVKSEADIRRRAKEAESDRKTLEKFLADGRLDVVLKIKELFSDAQDKTFDDLAAAVQNAGKKKK